MGDSPVIVPLMDQTPGVANMLPPDDHALQQVRVFPVFNRSLTPDALLRATVLDDRDDREPASAVASARFKRGERLVRVEPEAGATPRETAGAGDR
jgi:hypothetical protein